MIKINKQIEEIRQLFNTKNIVDETSRIRLTDDELIDSIDVIKKNKKDGVYEISEELELRMKKGVVTLLDRY